MHFEFIFRGTLVCFEYFHFFHVFWFLKRSWTLVERSPMNHRMLQSVNLITLNMRLRVLLNPLILLQLAITITISRPLITNIPNLFRHNLCDIFFLLNMRILSFLFFSLSAYFLLESLSDRFFFLLGF